MSDAVLRWWRPPGSPQGQTVSASPWTYTNASSGKQLVALVGGVTSLVEVNVGSGFGVVALGLGLFYLNPGDQIRITYIVTPPVVTVVQL